MASFLASIFNKKSKSVLGIDIGSASIKVVQLRRAKGRAILETYGELSLGPYAGAEIGQATRLDAPKLIEALNDVLKEAHTTTRSAAISIPMKSSMVSTIKMPEMSDKQLSEMVPIEARKYIPVPISEVTLDWFRVPSLDQDEAEARQDRQEQNESTNPHAPVSAKQIEVLTVAIHNDVLNKYASIISGAQLEASFFEIEMFSTIRSVLQPGDNRPVMIFDMGSAATKMYIVERGILRDSHVINKGSQDITANISKSLGVSMEFAEKLKRNFGHNTDEQDLKIKEIVDLVITPILSETNAVLLNFQRKYNRDISKVVLVGGGSLLYGMIDRANEKLSIPAVAGEPFSKVAAPAFLDEVLKYNGMAFAPSIGLALRKLQELG